MNFVLIDTPPVIPVTDAVIIGSNVEGGADGHQGRTIPSAGWFSRRPNCLTQAHANGSSDMF